MPYPLGHGAYATGPGEQFEGSRAALRLGRVVRRLQGGIMSDFLDLAHKKGGGGGVIELATGCCIGVIRSDVSGAEASKT
jgi:hypothetical protein